MAAQTPDVSRVVCATCAILGIYFTLSSGEMLCRASALQDGLLAWHYGRLWNAWLVRGPADYLLDRVLEYPAVIALIVLRLIAGVLLASGAVIALARPVVTVSIIVADTTSLGISLRHAHGSDGADQFAFISIVASLSGPWTI